MLIKLRENGSQIGFDQTFVKSKLCQFSFRKRKIVDIDGVYNVENDRLWASSRVEANECDGIKMKRKFPPSGDGVAGRMLQTHHTTDHFRRGHTQPSSRHKGSPSSACKIWQRLDISARVHIVKNGAAIIFHRSSTRTIGPDLNPLDYSIWDQLAERDSNLNKTRSD